MTWYKYVMFIGIPLMIVCWVAYYIYNYIMDQREKKNPPQRSEKLQQAQSSMSEYAQKMKDYKRKRYDKKQ